VLLLTALVVGLMRRVSGVLERAEQAFEGLASFSPEQGLQPGDIVTGFTLKDSSGSVVTSDSLWAHAPAIVAFLSRGCEPCEEIERQLRELRWSMAAVRLILVLSGHDTHDVSTYGDAEAYTQGSDLAASRAFRTNISPHAFAVDRGGRVRANLIPRSADELVDLATSQWGVAYSDFSVLPPRIGG